MKQTQFSAHMPTQFHDPVLLAESLNYLVTNGGRIYVDGTTGGGGHAEAICKHLSGEGRLVCLDADEDALSFAQQRLSPYSKNVDIVHGNFRDLKQSLLGLGIHTIDGLILDLGVSSYQIDEGLKGFSYRADGPLDMRMDRRQERAGWDVVNFYSQDRLEEVLREFGEERHARRIAMRIVNARPVATTNELADVVRSAADPKYVTQTLSRVFQAIRIEVNEELQSLLRVLPDAVEMLGAGGRLVVISYHSLEDRIVKEFFRDGSATHIPSGVKLIPDTPITPTLKVLTKKPLVSGSEEINRNPRARSAKLRAAEKI